MINMINSDTYLISTYKDEQLICYFAKQIRDFPNYYITECGRVFSTNIYSFLSPRDKCGYASVSLSNSHTSKSITVHRLVALHWIEGASNERVVDHKDRNPKNNHRSNLRWITKQQNSWNRGGLKGASSPYVGVSKNCSGTFTAAIKLNGKRIMLGTFKDELEAAQMYLKAKALYHKI